MEPLMGRRRRTMVTVSFTAIFCLPHAQTSYLVEMVSEMILLPIPCAKSGTNLATVPRKGCKCKIYWSIELLTVSFEKYFKTELGFYLHSCGLTRALNCCKTEWLFNYVLKVALSQPEHFVPLNAALALRGSSVQAETHHLKKLCRRGNKQRMLWSERTCCVIMTISRCIPSGASELVPLYWIAPLMESVWVPCLLKASLFSWDFD